MEIERPVPSPCVHVCALDDDDTCLGCQRSIDEISRWGRMDNTERREVLARCLARARDKGQLMA
ncbi:DUF1289 domain-containing protein [Metapseudomonas otitidis]|uniref:DUF1289 domain-containing protein n=1 Tax=Metapseudomonas otitidis TaxID=319939 RepID=UPI00244BFD90|nr:DUF1289 domain-containing protein [Pseudomonas otitidis]MDG9783817.1 DUF1289 domain-containing protein [Pseudomonas otitidis]